MEKAKLILEFLKVILSTAPVIGLIALISIFLFKEQIRALILRLAELNFPGGKAKFDSQLEKSKESLPGSVEQSKPSAKPMLPENISLSPEDATRVLKTFNAERARATLWEYRYLNYYLVRNTQVFLDWLISLSMATTIAMVDAWWLPLIPSAAERKAVLDALQMHHLVELKGELIEVTPKGKEYQKWRGVLLPAAS